MQCSDETVFPRVDTYEFTDAVLTWKSKSKNEIYSMGDCSPAYKVCRDRAD